jgi:hypothetical protein
MADTYCFSGLVDVEQIWFAEDFNEEGSLSIAGAFAKEVEELENLIETIEDFEPIETPMWGTTQHFTTKWCC